MYLNSSFNCIKSSSITLQKATGGTGYTSVPTIVITPAYGDLGSGAAATITMASGVLGTLTMVNTGKGYNTLPTITLSGGGNPGVITGYSALVGGSGYILPPTVTATGGGGSAIPVLNDTSTSITYYPALSSITTGTLSTATISSTKLYYTANNGTLNATIFNSLSDITQKANISVISNGLEIVDGLRGVTFDWVDGSGSSAGLVAQDVEKWLPQLVNTGPDGVKNLNYSGIIGVLVEAVKNLSQRVNDLEAGK